MCNSKLNCKNSNSNSNSNYKEGLNIDLNKKGYQPRTLNFIKDIENVVCNILVPHYQSLRINVEDVENILSITSNLYEQDLQNSLMKFELHKMPVTVNYICNNKGKKFKNKGGTISIGLGLSGNDLKSDENSKCFSYLKSISSFYKYIINKISGDDILGVYGELYYMFPELKEVTTYTIIYIMSDNSIREVTLHDFGVYGSILTTLDLEYTG